MRNKSRETLAKPWLWQRIQSQQVGNGEQVCCVSHCGQEGTERNTKNPNHCFDHWQPTAGSHTIPRVGKSTLADEAADAPLAAASSLGWTHTPHVMISTATWPFNGKLAWGRKNKKILKGGKKMLKVEAELHPGPLCSVVDVVSLHWVVGQDQLWSLSHTWKSKQLNCFHSGSLRYLTLRRNAGGRLLTRPPAAIYAVSYSLFISL